MWPFSEMSLSAATVVGTIANWILLVSLLGGVLSTFIIVKTTDVKEEHWADDRRKSNEHIARLSAEAEFARAGVAAAQEETAKANRATEELRRQNLDLEKAFSPRMLMQYPAAEKLAPFVPTKVMILSLPDFEARRMAGQIAMLLELAKWPKAERQLTMDARDGILIEVPLGIGPGQSTPPSDAAMRAADALRDVIRASEIEASRLLTTTLAEGQIRITVGAKPVSEYLYRRSEPDWAREMRERMEQREKAMKDRLNKP
jgi:hypothetical protein